ncbi:MAG TPA: addiction module antidote protein [Xanthobacteraceae bacterium]|jgi:probable addiction module antidote protein|nr:addiction module antidote protein [Xanthobacteraceae bacterium]
MAVKTTRFDSAEYLDSAEAISAYLKEALETDDPAFITQARGTVVRARHVASRQGDGVSRESLYKALSAEGNPEFSTEAVLTGHRRFADLPPRV